MFSSPIAPVKKIYYLPLQQQLMDDATGVFRDTLSVELKLEKQVIKSKLDAGLSAEDYLIAQKIHTGIEAAEFIVENTWKFMHTRTD